MKYLRVFFLFIVITFYIDKVKALLLKTISDQRQYSICLPREAVPSLTPHAINPHQVAYGLCYVMLFNL
jgi:hypothetical protein